MYGEGYPTLTSLLTASDDNEVIFLDYSECGTNGEPIKFLVDQAMTTRKLFVRRKTLRTL